VADRVLNVLVGEYGEMWGEMGEMDAPHTNPLYPKFFQKNQIIKYYK